MLKPKLLRVVNFFLILSALCQMTTGTIVFLTDHISSFPAIPLIDPIHNYNGLFMTALIVIHVILNWTWIKNTFFTRKKTENKGS